MKKSNQFYTDLNLINLPIFTASKKIKNERKIEEIILDKNGIKTKLIIQFPEEKLTFFDRKVLATIEYLFCHRYNVISLEEAYIKEYDKTKDWYLKEFKKKEKELKESDKQQIIYETMNNLQKAFKLGLTLKNLNDFVYNKTYGHSKVKKSLLKLQNTYIKQESDYFIDGSRLELPEIPLLTFSSSREQKSNNNSRENIIISLNAFHLVNLMKKNFVISDLKLLTSFDSSIAGRLSELIKKSLYGSKIFNKDKVSFPYEYISEYLQIEKRGSLSRIKQQLEELFKELIDKKIIVNWLLQKNLFDYEIVFFHSLQFYENYWENLEEITKKLINQGLAKLIRQEDKYKKFEEEVNTFMETVKVKDSAEKERIKIFYIKYYYLDNYLKSEVEENTNFIRC